MTEFVNLMKYAFGDNNERKRILNKIQDKRVVQLLQSEDIENTTLIQEEVYKEVLAGANPMLCMRDALPVIKVNTNSLRYVIGESGSYAAEVAEGAEIPINTQDYTKVDFVIKKVGVRPLITKELIEDGLFDIVALELRKAGENIENKLNKDAVEALLRGASATAVTYNATNGGVQAVASAITNIKKNGFVPNTLVLSAYAEGELLKDSNLAYANRAGDTEAIRRGGIGTTLLGLTPYVTTVDAESNSKIFGDGAATGSPIAVVYDKNAAGAIAMRRDLTVDRYEDPIRDLVGMSITMRYATEPLLGKSISIIKV